MKARLIQFHISPPVKDDHKSQTARVQNGFNLEFVATNKYLAEDLRGIPEFRRELRHKMQHIVQQFNEYYQWNIDKSEELDGNSENLSSLENLNDAVKYLLSLLKNDFLVPNELELIAIHMVGDFNIYQPGHDTELKRQAAEIRQQSIADFQKQHRL